MFGKPISWALFVVLTLSALPATAATAFFYGKDLPPELLAHYDRIVVEPDHFSSAPRSSRAEPFAYVAVGEVHPTRAWYKHVPKSFILGKNAAWGSEIVDTRNPLWRAFVLDRVIEPLWSKGYRGFFLDTLDSYEQKFSDPKDRDANARQLGALVNSIRERHPDAKVILNRGFDVLPYVSKIDGFVAESLLSRSAVEQEALLKKLRAVQARWRVPITIIDYAPVKDTALRRSMAKRIVELGFEPWIATQKLDDIGVGPVEIVPRRVVIVHQPAKQEAWLGIQDAAVLVAPVLEWLGYAVDYADVAKPLPPTKGRYAGIVTMVSSSVPNPRVYRAWLLDQIAAGVRIAFLDGFGFDPDAGFLGKLGLEPAKITAKAPLEATTNPAFFGFEAPVRPRLRDRPPVRAVSADVQSILRLTDADGAVWDGGVLGPWGGAAFLPYVLEERLEEERRFILEPFAFLKAALALPPIPAPDVTTEAGRRILTAHVDGDAFVSRVERPKATFTAQVVLEEVLGRWRIPHTVSIVEGEVSRAGMYPQYSAELETLARRIFALPHVEMASHTYSHPFEWPDAENGRRGPTGKLPHLAIPGYTFDLERELRGSIEYINRLGPPGKRVKVLLWSGDCDPSDRAVALAQSLGVFNVNGGGALRTYDRPSLTRGSPMGIPRGATGWGQDRADGTYQVFAPVENENVYTNDWTGPFDAYRHAVETFQLDGSPRRLRPISIYYHFYSAAKTASLRGLQRAYEWAVAQETTPLFLSEYAARVLAFQRATLARRIDGAGWEIGNAGALGTVRLDPSLGWPDVGRSVGVAGARSVTQGMYVHLTDDRTNGVVFLALRSQPDAGPRLVHANGHVRHWTSQHGRVSLRIVAGVPLAIEVVASAPCTMLAGGNRVAGAVTQSGRETFTRFRLSTTDTGEAILECR